MYYVSKPILRKYRWKNSKTQRKISNKNLAFGYFAHITQSSSAMWKDQSRLPNFLIVPQKSYKWPGGPVPAVMTENMTFMTFLCTITLRNKTVAHTCTFLPLFDNANGCLCQERLSWSRKFATMVLPDVTLLLPDDGLRGLNPATWDLCSYKTLSGGSVKKIFSWNKTMCDYLLTSLVFWYSYYLKCCQGFEDGNVALQSYVITKFYQFFPTTNLKVQKNCKWTIEKSGNKYYR